ncbi:restriction endonuclease fold toxin 5 domain-containing protein [Archangium lipolyticum]|uniref:restriction endonuclease fold toxin 5 domain-containing protein n=1 Tax=Archangium lipolyticum TaxID=2970465 RepID=UPI00214A2E69|nr:restriction endonuclease fold toxin 5 domain-containing protein [Archangium lipolyticum]
MAKEHRSPGAGEGGGKQLKAWRSSRGRPWWASGVLALAFLALQAACAKGYPMGGTLAGGTARHWGRAQRVSPGTEGRAGGARAVAMARPDAPGGKGSEGAEASEAEGDESARWPRRQARRPSKTGEQEDLEGKGVGWRDGVGDGRPHEVPVTLDYFQGFLVQAGVPTSAVPGDGRTLAPQQAVELVPHLLATPVTLGNFGLRRMAAHLLLEVATGGIPVSRDELHARMRRFSHLLVLRPDGYLVKTTSGVAVQKAGQVVLAEDGTLRAGRFEVGPFYAIDGGRLFPVDAKLEVPEGARPVGIYEPDDNAGLAVAEGTVLAVVDLVEGLYRLVFYTGETLEGLAQLPGAVRQLYESSPLLWEEFRHKPYAEKVRTVSRLTMGVVLTVGTSGAGAAKAASWGGNLASVTVPLLSLSGDGLLAVRLVAVPAGAAVSVAGNALSATYVLHMANTGARGAGGGGGWPPVGGPGQWVEDTSSMSEQARSYQAQVTGAPRRWCYRVCRGGDCVDYDGYDPKTGILLESKAREYDKWFDKDLRPQWNYQGLKDMISQAQRQVRFARGMRVRWHVAEERMVAVLRKHFDAEGLQTVEVVYTRPVFSVVRGAAHE